MAQPATGAAVLAGIRRELAGQPGVPDTSKSRIWLEPDLPLTADLVRVLGAANEANAQGFGVRGIPGAITGPVDFAIPLRASTSLEIFEHLLGGAGALTKSEPESGVFKYEGEPVARTDAVDTTHDLLVALPPVDRVRLSHMMWGSLSIPIAGNSEISARLAGFVSHSTHLAAATAGGGNTGTYTEGPDVRGPLRRPRQGERLYLKVTSASPLQIKAERVPNGGTATYPGAAIDAAYDSAGNGTWQALAAAYQLTGTVSVGAASAAVTGVGTLFLDEVKPHIAQGVYITIAGESKQVLSVASNTSLTLAATHTAGASGVVAHLLNQDAGYWNENRDTCDVIFPGTLAGAQADIDANDIWYFESDWSSDPTPTYIGGQRFTSAHWSAFWRRQGATTWNPLQVISGTLTIPNPVSASAGWGSRHYVFMDRDGLLLPTVQVVRRFDDHELQTLAESHEPFEFYCIAEGQRLGTGAYRESIRIDAPAAEFTTRAAPVSGPAAVQETLTMTFKASEDGDPPLTTTTYTDRDYTVAA